MDELKDRYYELDEIVSSIEILVEQLTDPYYIDVLNEIRFKAQDEREELEPRIAEMEQLEMQEQELEFERSRLC